MGRISSTHMKKDRPTACLAAEVERSVHTTALEGTTVSPKSKPSSPKWLHDSGSVPCPPWCMGGHRKDHEPDDRNHLSRWQQTMRPALMDVKVYRKRTDGSGLWDNFPWELEVYVHQKWREIEPSIRIAPDLADSPIGEGLNLTVAEAIKLRGALDKAIELARGGAR